MTTFFSPPIILIVLAAFSSPACLVMSGNWESIKQLSGMNVVGEARQAVYEAKTRASPF